MFSICLFVSITEEDMLLFAGDVKAFNGILEISGRDDDYKTFRSKCIRNIPVLHQMRVFEQV